MKSLLLVVSICIAATAFGQDKPKPVTRPPYDEPLAKRLGGDERAMKSYVLVILKTGSKADISKEESSKLFGGTWRISAGWLTRGNSWWPGR